MSGPKKERCADCYYCEVIEHGRCGVCRFNAPTPQIIKVGIQVDTQIPRVDLQKCWCGQFRKADLV